MKFGKIENWILAGGEDLIVQAAKFLADNKENFFIITGSRNLKEKLRNGKSLKQNFEANNFNYHISEDINNDEIVDRYIKKKTILLSLSSPWIFKEDFIKKFNKGVINLHEANLPLNRGGATISWMIMMNLKNSGSVLHFVTPKIDGGDVLMSSSYTFPKTCKIPIEYSDFIFSKSSSLINRFLSNILNNHSFKLAKQNEIKSTYWPRLNTEKQGYINWSWDIEDIASFIHSFDDPYSGSRSFINKDEVIIKHIEIFLEKNVFHPFQSGIIYRKAKKQIYVAANRGTLIIRSIKSKKGQDIFSKIRIGDRIHTPNKYLEKSLMLRPVYSSKGLEK